MTRRKAGLMRQATDRPPRDDGWHIQHRCAGTARQVTTATVPGMEGTFLVCVACREMLAVVKHDAGSMIVRRPTLVGPGGAPIQ